MRYATDTAPESGPPKLPVVLLLPGQGSQYPGMALELYRTTPVFAAAMDEVFELLGRDGPAVRADWLADDPVVPLDHVTRSQILLFAVDYALGRLVLSWGVRPVAMLGHSMGEFVAATLAGVFDLPDAVRIAWRRVNQLATAPPGGMIAVAASADRLEPYLHGDVVVGAVNSPRQTIIAGPSKPLRQTTERLEADGFTLRTVPALTAFHSPALSGLSAQARPLFAGTPMRAPQTLLYSGFTGAPMTADEAVSADFWADQPAAPVLFWPALDALLHDLAAGHGRVVLCEVGPGTMLSAVAYRHPAVAGGDSVVVTLLARRPGSAGDEHRAVMAAAAQLRALGAAPSLAGTA